MSAELDLDDAAAPHPVAVLELAALRTERAELKRAAQQVIAHMDGRMPVRGWLKDNDDSREALAELVRVLGA